MASWESRRASICVHSAKDLQRELALKQRREGLHLNWSGCGCPCDCIGTSRLGETVDTRIRSIHAREIVDSRGNPTVEVDVALAGSAQGRAAGSLGSFYRYSRSRRVARPGCASIRRKRGASGGCACEQHSRRSHHGHGRTWTKVRSIAPSLRPTERQTRQRLVRTQYWA